MMTLTLYNSPQESVLPQTKHLVSKEPEVEHGHTGKRDDSHPGWDGGGQCDFHHTTENGAEFQTE